MAQMYLQEHREAEAAPAVAEVRKACAAFEAAAGSDEKWRGLFKTLAGCEEALRQHSKKAGAQ